MTIHTELNNGWLTSLLNGLGSTGDEVADALRDAQVTGTPADIWNDPVAVYIGVLARRLLSAPEIDILVVVTDEEVLLAITAPSTDPHEISANIPDAVEDFLYRFDSGQDYSDLAGNPES